MEIKNVMTWYIWRTVTDGKRTVKHRVPVHGFFYFQISPLPHLSHCLTI